MVEPAGGVVSVIMPFFDAQEFIEESIQSVFAQTYERWELLLIDDGSRDGSTKIALEYADRYSGKVRCLEHPGRQNLGQAASRNLGYDYARGDYIATLDSDDLLYPNQLADQVRLLEENPTIGAVYGGTLVWRSWTGDPADRGDWVTVMGVEDNTLLTPPELATRYLRREATPPWTCSVLIRREAIERTGGCEVPAIPHFKVFLHYPVLATSRSWGKYRQHPHSIMGGKTDAVKDLEALEFFGWLAKHLRREGAGDRDLWKALNGRLWPYRHPFLHTALLHVHPLANTLAHLRWLALRKLPGQRGGEIVAHPNPMRIPDAGSGGGTTISWSAQGVEAVEVRVDAPDGPLFGRSPGSGSQQTGNWVTDGMVFYLQDASARGGLTADDTLATVKVRVAGPSSQGRIPLRDRLRFPQWRDAHPAAPGVDESSSGECRLRDEALAEWILEAHPGTIFEFAARGPELAMLVENEVREYVWSALAGAPIEAARKQLRKAAVRGIDICDGYKAVSWGRYDAAVFVSLGRIPNDLEILSEVSPGASVFLSCAASEKCGSARAFPTEQSVRDRFAGLLEILRVRTVAGHFIAHGVRKDRRYTARELRRMFFTKHRHYLKKQTEMQRFVARNLYGRVLEVGCWDGFLYPYLTCEKYTGVDMCREAIEEARREYPGKFFVSDWDDLSCSGDADSIYFNAVLSCQSDKTGTAGKYERLRPSRIVVQDLEEARIELPYRLRSSKSFYLDANEPERSQRRVVRVFDL
jgi:glycosyltransferase involved in cell wall biosynthesis/SAM-dependent methyltransferase